MLRVPIGVSDFKRLRSDQFAYVDKSRFIVEVLNHPAAVLLFPRPRRFGKTLNLSMLHCFLDRKHDNRALFAGLAVENYPEIMAKCGAFPTIFLTFKDLKNESWETCKQKLMQLITQCFLLHKESLLAAQPEYAERTHLDAIFHETANFTVYENALEMLCRLLQRATGQKVVLLIDEYDTPIHAGYHNGYYGEVVSFMRNFLSAGLKDNPSLEKGVLTGILRVARESIFSGLNNLHVRTLLDEPFSNHFGFTQSEVDALLQPCKLDEQEVQAWYNGYRFGSHVIYNPWSIIQVAANPEAPLQPHWVNTSDNELIRKRITEGRGIQADDLKRLLSGEGLVRKLDSNLVLGQDPEGVWSLLLFSGYLTSSKTEFIDGYPHCELRIPNREVRIFFEKSIQDWVRAQMGPSGLTPFFKALAEQDFELVEELLTQMIRQVLSYHDIGGQDQERVYHAFLLGLLMDWNKCYEILSNRESGWGRYDLALFPRQQGVGYLFEFKRGQDLKKAARTALAQIEKKDYVAAFQSRGIREATLIGVGLNGKGCQLVTSTWRNPELQP